MENNIRGKILVPLSMTQHNATIDLFKSIHYEPNEEVMLNFYNVVIDAAQMSNTKYVDTSYMVNKSIRMIVKDEILMLMDQDLLISLTYIIYDMVIYYRSFISFIELNKVSLYVTKITDTFMIIEYFIKG